MKTITKILIAFLTITMIITPAMGYEQPEEQHIEIISDGHIHQNPSGGHQYTKGTLTIPLPTDSTSINSYQYEDIEITSVGIPEAPEQGTYASIILEHF